MSDQSNFFVGKYNFSRRVVDHRFPHDFNHDINLNPLKFGWRLSMKNLLIGNVVRNIAVWYCGGAFVLGALLNGVAAIVYQGDGELKHVFHSPRETPNQTYLLNVGNRVSNMGKWNGNFQCWENDPFCGRDFK